MTQIFPFRGVIYNIKKVKDFSRVLTQPYDKIDDRMQKTYYAKHLNNLVRITKGMEQANDNELNNKYTRAGEFFRQWLKEKILVQDEKPAIYVYYQTYQVDGFSKIRKGFIALGKLLDYGKKGVHAHERTLLKPKQDRLNLMRSVGGSTGQIFMLYSDPKLVINRLMDKTISRKKPDVAAKDESGVIHEVWRLTQPAAIQRIAKRIAGRDVFIADGHHRYETALNYRNEMRRKKIKCIEPESYRNRMMTFVNMDDEGLTILPTHRLIFGLKNFSFGKFLKKLAPYFRTDVFYFHNGRSEEKTREILLANLRKYSDRAPTFALMGRGLKKYFLLTLRNEKMMNKIITERHSADWKRLDVTILHSLILDHLLGITREKLEQESNVRYTRYVAEAVEAVRAPTKSGLAPIKSGLAGKFQMAFLLNPTKIQEVKKVAAGGERMPQKSTDFYPKLLSGIVISKINF